MSACRTILLFFLLGPAVLLSCGTAALAETVWQPPSFYGDLPGVKSQEDYERENALTCRQILVPHGSPKVDQTYDTVNACRKGSGPEFKSGRLPLSLERQKRGFSY